MFSNVTNCDVCLNQRNIEIPGKPIDAMGDHANDYLESAILIVRALQGETMFPRCPTELYAQPAKWMAAFDFLQPFAQLEIKQYLDSLKP